MSRFLTYSFCLFAFSGLTLAQQQVSKTDFAGTNGPAAGLNSDYGSDGTQTVCADAIPIISGNFTNMDLTCGTSDDLNANTINGEMCPDDGPLGGQIPASYVTGHEALYSYTPSADGEVTVTVHNTTWTALLVYEGCPIDGSCVTATRSTSNSRTVTFFATANTEYFIWIDTWPDPQSPCAEGGQMDFSGPEPVGGGYCTPSATDSSKYINTFETTGANQNISNPNSGFSAGGYGDFYDTHTVSQNRGGTVDFFADFEGGGTFGFAGAYGFRVWVDWNGDNVFGPDEVAFASTGLASSWSGSFTVPVNAQLGETRMRIVNSSASETADVDPCATGYTDGEFEDYKFIVEEEILGECVKKYIKPDLDLIDYSEGAGFSDGYKVANDFIIPANSQYIIQDLEFAAMYISGEPDYFIVQVFKDNGSGGIGDQVTGEILFNSGSYGYTYIGDWVGMMPTYIIEIPIDNVLLQNTTGSDEHYWIAVESSFSTTSGLSYWPSNENTGNPSYPALQYDPSLGSWDVFNFPDESEGYMIVDGDCGPLGVSDILNSDFSYSPNPVTDILNINSKTNIVKVEVYDLSGKQALKSVSAKDGKTDLSSLAPGVYVCRVLLEGGKIETFKIVKK